MDKTVKYRKICTEYLRSIASEWSDSASEETQVVCDPEDNHFLLVQYGWNEYGHVHQVPIHLNIQDGKIWIQENLTELRLDDDLIALGIPKSDIVLGVIPPEYRKFSEYEAA